jgi:WD40 repeat protein
MDYGRLLAVSGNQGVISLIDVDAEEEVMRLAGNDSSVFKMTFTHDGRKLVSSQIGGETHVWDVTQAGPPELEAIAILGWPHNGFVTASAGDQVGVFTESGGFEVHDLNTGEVTMALTGERVDNGVSRSSSPDLSLVGSLPVEGNATIRTIPTNEVVAEFDPCTYAVAFSPDNSLALINRSLCEHTSTDAAEVIQVEDKADPGPLPTSRRRHRGVPTLGPPQHSTRSEWQQPGATS